MLFSLKVTFSKKICRQHSTLYMPKLPYVKIFLGYEIYTQTQTPKHPNSSKSLKIVNCKEHKSNVLSTYSLKCTK